MTSSEVLFFDKNQDLFPLYQCLAEKVIKKYGNETKVKVSKTQISFSNRHIFLVISIFKKQLMVTVGLPHKSQWERIMQSVEAYPGRWTHHIIITGSESIDEPLMELIDESYMFSKAK